MKNRILKMQAGYSLISTAILLLSIGVMLTVAITIYKNRVWIEKETETNDSIAQIHEALLKYRFENNRFPCPAPMDAKINTAEFGREKTNCSGTKSVPGARGNGAVRIGALPVRELNLPENMIADSWNHRFVYAVTEYYTSKDPNLNMNTDKGAITISDSKKKNVTLAPGNVVFLVISPGADARGAYSLDGKMLASCDVTSPAGENCDEKNAVFRSTIYRQWDVGKNTYTASMAYLAGTKAYRWRTTNWTECKCGMTEQTRTATCVDEFNKEPYPKNKRLNDSFCANSIKPELRKVCVAYCRDAGPWTPCVCDGISTRITYCRSNTHIRVTEPFCRTYPKLADKRQCGSCPPTGDSSSDPLIFDLTDDGIKTLGVEAGVLFDVDNTGRLVQSGWAHPDDGLLAHDKDGNGMIDRQDELFGKTGIPAFDQLAEYDTNGDGDITTADLDWGKLLIWRDRNTNGVSDPGELKHVDYHNIYRIPLAHDDVFKEDKGNQITGEGYFEQFIEGVGLVKKKLAEVFFSIFRSPEETGPPNR